MKKFIASLLAAVTAFSAVSVCMAAEKIENAKNYNGEYFPEGSKKEIKVLNDDYNDSKYYDIEVNAFLKVDDEGDAEIVYMR